MKAMEVQRNLKKLKELSSRKKLSSGVRDLEALKKMS